MRIALLISGRATTYEECLLPLLKKETPHTYDLFMSLNGEESDYFKTMRQELSPWLKGCFIQPYTFPSDFHHTHSFCEGYRNIDNRLVPYNQMSMFFNDSNAFKLACEFSKQNGFEYDYFMKFRADIMTDAFPTVSHPKKLKLHLYSIKPNCYFVSKGLIKKMIVSDACAWGNYQTMSIYCNTCKYVLDMLKQTNGNYCIHFESCVSDNIYDNVIKVEYVDHVYKLHDNRKSV